MVLLPSKMVLPPSKMEVAPFFVDFHHFLSIFTIFYRFSRFTHFCCDLHFVAIYALFPQIFFGQNSLLRNITRFLHVCSEPTCQTSSQQPPRRGSSPRSPGSSTFTFSIVYENNSYKSIVEVPKVNRRHTALKIHFSVLVERTFLTLSLGIAPPSRTGSYWLLQVDLYESPSLL